MEAESVRMLEHMATTKEPTADQMAMVNIEAHQPESNVTVSVKNIHSGHVLLSSPISRKPRVKMKKPIAPRQTVQSLLNSSDTSTTMSPTCAYIIPVPSLNNKSKLHEPKSLVGSSIMGLNSVVPINLAPTTTTLPSISAITLPMLSPKNAGMNNGENPACLEDYVTNIVGQSLGHLGSNITSADLVDKVTQVLKALNKESKMTETRVGMTQDGAHSQSNNMTAPQEQQQAGSVAIGYYSSSSSQESGTGRYHQDDPHWNTMESQSSSSSSQMLGPFASVVEATASEHDSGKGVFAVDESGALPLEVAVSEGLKGNGVFNILKDGEAGRVIGSVSADMLDLIMDTVALPTQSKSSDSLDTVSSQLIIHQQQDDYCEPASTSEYYCVDCDGRYAPQPCPTHHAQYTAVADTPILSAARMSVPALLEIRRSQVASGEEGVFAVETVERRTRFGPLIGERRLLNPGEEADGQFVWLNAQKTGVICCVDENKSNWMRFVQLARNRAEQNMVAFMENGQIYMVTCRDVAADTEVKLWYSADYAAHIGITPIACPTLKCDSCNRRLTSKTQLKQHRTYCHPEEAKHRCAYCTSEFVSDAALQKHCRRHLENGTEKGGLKCGYCEKTFTNAGNLKVHMRIHTGEKRYSCEICHRSFTQHAHLRCHQLTHSKVKNYNCPFCAKTFARTCDLRVHERVHTRQNIMRCEECGKEFFKLDNYKCHKKIHLNQKDFACVTCGKAFSKKYHLVRHLRSCKGGKVDR